MPPTSSRAYGKACIACRTRKRRCYPSQRYPGSCDFCETTGISCQSSSKRQRRSTVDMSQRGSMMASSSSSLSPDRFGSTAEHHTQPHRQVSAEPEVLAPGDWLLGSQQSVHRSEVQVPGETFKPSVGSLATTVDVAAATSPSMTVGHGSVYRSSLNELVSRVCGPSHTTEPVEELLEIYFAWQEPQHMPVDEALFRRDMQSIPQGPYFSTMLLHAIHAQASRHLLRHDDGWSYADRASALLLAGLSDPPSIPTIQALLIMAGRELALGASSAGWLKSGMAFRMIEEMALDKDAYAEIDLVPLQDRETAYMRQRVFWSAYSWDKFFALTLGRQPAMHATRSFAPIPELKLLETQWRPQGTDLSYPYHTSYTGATFHALCLLNIALEAITARLYSNRNTPASESEYLMIEDLRQSLLAWRSKVSPHVLLDTSYLPSVCPPPHILTLNILYRTTWILLLRRAIRYEGSDGASRRACLARSAEIHQLFRLHQTTFSLRNLTYITAYSAYVSATVDVAEALSNQTGQSTEASTRLQLTLQVLTQAAHHTPGIQRSIAYLRHRLDRPMQSFFDAPSGATTPTTAHPLAEIPVTSIDSAMDLGRQDAMTTNLFGSLPLVSGFEELFASLLPEYAPDPLADLNLGSTANLPMLQEDWLAAFE